jgi:uncharacterized membrane protein YczE
VKIPSLEQVVRLIAGLFLFALGIAIQLRAAIGMAPWDVFARGTANVTGFSFGVSTVVASAIVLMLWIPLKQRPGVGTIMNAALIGPFVDFCLGFLPIITELHFVARTGFFILGVAILAVGTGLYISARLGPGPRDGLMTGAVRRFNKPVWLVRMIIEGSATVLGFAAGGAIGLGTVLFVFFVGPMVQVMMKAFGLIGPPRTG